MILPCSRYAKDTSKKIRAVVKMRGEAGEHLASNPPYGYVKDLENKKHWIVDEEAAKVVRRIFDHCIAGKGSMQIAKILPADKVLTVTAYNARQKGWVLPENLYRWSQKSIVGVLERRYRLYRQFQDLYQISEIQKTDGKSKRESADI